MKVEQIYSIINSITSEALGESAVLAEDLSNIVDIGTQLFDNTSVDNYVRSLVDHIGKVIFVNRVYRGAVPSVIRDAWEYGAVCEKITVDMPEATENESWELEDGASYDPNIFYKPSVSAKFFSKRVTFEIPYSFTERQVRGSFSSGTQMNAFLSMLENAVEKSMTVKIDELIMRGINSMIADTVYDDYAGVSISSKSGIKAVNLLYLYNQQFSKSLQADDALVDEDFLKFAAYTMGMYEKRVARISTLFNIGGKDRFTSPDLLHFVLLADFAKAADVYLQSNTFHDEFTRLPNAETVPYWQGSGTSYSFTDTGKVYVSASGGAHSQTVTGVLGVMFDHDAVGVSNLSQRTTTNYNAKAEFWSNWAKFETGLWNDENENFVVFFVA